MTNAEMRDAIGDLRCRLEFLSLATTGMFEGDSIPSDDVVCGLHLAFHDCIETLDKLGAELKEAA